MSGELEVVKTYADLHAIVRQRVADLNVSHASVDHVAGLNDGYFGKLMARMKHLGPQTMPLVLCALGIKLVAVVDVEAQESLHQKNADARDCRQQDARDRKPQKQTPICKS